MTKAACKHLQAAYLFLIQQLIDTIKALILCFNISLPQALPSDTQSILIGIIMVHGFN